MCHMLVSSYSEPHGMNDCGASTDCEIDVMYQAHNIMCSQCHGIYIYLTAQTKCICIIKHYTLM